MRADAKLAKGDLDGQRVWLAIVRKVEELAGKSGRGLEPRAGRTPAHLFEPDQRKEVIFKDLGLIAKPFKPLAVLGYDVFALRAVFAGKASFKRVQRIRLLSQLVQIVRDFLAGQKLGVQDLARVLHDCAIVGCAVLKNVRNEIRRDIVEFEAALEKVILEFGSRDMQLAPRHPRGDKWNDDERDGLKP